MANTTVKKHTRKVKGKVIPVKKHKRTRKKIKNYSSTTSKLVDKRLKEDISHSDTHQQIDMGDLFDRPITDEEVMKYENTVPNVALLSKNINKIYNEKGFIPKIYIKTRKGLKDEEKDRMEGTYYDPATASERKLIDVGRRFGEGVTKIKKTPKSERKKQFLERKNPDAFFSSMSKSFIHKKPLLIEKLGKGNSFRLNENLYDSKDEFKTDMELVSKFVDKKNLTKEDWMGLGEHFGVIRKDLMSINEKEVDPLLVKIMTASELKQTWANPKPNEQILKKYLKDKRKKQSETKIKLWFYNEDKIPKQIEKDNVQREKSKNNRITLAKKMAKHSQPKDTFSPYTKHKKKQRKIPKSSYSFRQVFK